MAVQCVISQAAVLLWTAMMWQANVSGSVPTDDTPII